MKTSIFEKNIEEIKMIARKISKQFYNRFEVDELVNAAWVGFDRSISNNPALIKDKFSKLSTLLFRVRCDILDYVKKELDLRKVHVPNFMSSSELHVPITDLGYNEVDNRDHVEQLTSTLSDEDWSIIQGYFYDEKPLKDIGKDLGISESAIWQRRKKTYIHMRNIDKVINRG